MIYNYIIVVEVGLQELQGNHSSRARRTVQSHRRKAACPQMDGIISGQSNPIIVLVMILSLALVVFSADKLIDHAVIVSEALGVPRIVVGATIISLGTTLPELATAIVAVSQGSSDLAVGNATGSVITNTTLALGAGAAFGSIPVLRETTAKLRIFTVVAIALMVFCLIGSGLTSFSSGGNLPQWAGIVLLAAVPMYLFRMFKGTARLKNPHRVSNNDNGQKGGGEPDKSDNGISLMLKSLCWVAVFAVFLALGSDAAVSSASTLAGRAGISEVLIASTIIALGTSLPELVTTVNAARKGRGDLAVGNVLGANILNMTLVLGYSASFSEGGVYIAKTIFTTHFPIMLVILAIISYMVYNTSKLRISRNEGIGLISLYAFYLVLLLVT
ncbi:MAG: Putative H+/Ca2+ antiporter [Bifidobacterium crudilactis]